MTLDWLEPLGRGSATLEGLTIAYAPLKDFFGDEAASLVVRDASGGQTVFSILFRVLPVNDSPSATPARWELNEDQEISFPLAGIDPDGDPLSFEVVSLPEHGHFCRAPYL